MEPRSGVTPHPRLRNYYGDDSEREEYVRDIFDETARWYDQTTRLLSFGSDVWYRKRALVRAGLSPGMRLLDLATGTGIVAHAALEATQGELELVGADVSLGMLSEASAKISSPLVNSKGESLPFADRSFDMISIGFAMRHLADLQSCFEELLRVLRPGGRIVILELTPPESRLGRSLLALYMNRIVPLVARLTSGERRVAELMHYYWDTTAACVPPATILDALRKAGFVDVDRHVEAFISSEYTGTAP